MAEDSGKNASGSGKKENDPMSASLVSGVVPPPSALPTFVTCSETQPLSATNTMFLPSTFSPEIPQTDKIDTSSSDNRYDSYDDSIGAVSSSLFGWVKDTVGNSSNLFSKVAEKAKNSVGAVITTLDPQIDFNLSNAGFEVLVTSEREVEISSIREAFQNAFTRITVRGLEVEEVNLAKQIVGFDSAAKAALMKINELRNRYSINGPVVAVQNFIAEVSEDKWCDLDLILLIDDQTGTNLESYSQMIPVPLSIINVVKEDSEENYEHSATGFSVPISHILGKNLQVHPSEWQETLTGVSRRQRILSAAKVVANLYKNVLS